jgi:hypothetical protein
MSTVSDVFHGTAIPTTHSAEASIALGQLAHRAMLGAKLLGAWGLRWDIQWHVRSRPRSG